MIVLKHWLETAAADILYLVVPWVHDRAKEADPAVKLASAKCWSRTYNDNGSCLDVPAVVHPSPDTHVQVLQDDPLLLTDGAVSIWASLTGPCKADLKARYPNRRGYPTTPNTILTIRNYTLRLTTYGPPQAHIALLLHQIDWLDVQPQPPLDTVLVPLRESPAVAPTWEKFRQARLDADKRCFVPKDDTDFTMAPPRAPDERRDAHMSSPSSQAPFATQVAHPLRHRTENTPRDAAHGQAGIHQKDVGRRPPEWSEAANDRHLLGHLSDKGPHSAVPPNAPKAAPPAPVAPSAGGFKRNHPGNVHGDSTVAPSLSRTPTLPGRPDRFLNDPRNDTPPPRDRSSPALVEPTSSELAEDDLDDEEPAWLKDCRPTCGCTNVSEKQRTLLSKPESWFKPDPGHRYPQLNVPIEISKELIQYHVTAHAQAEANSPIAPAEEDEDEGLPYVTLAEDMTNQVDAVTDDEMLTSPTSPIAWSTSPPRDSPKRPPPQALPPDSSFEASRAADAFGKSQSLAESHRPGPLAVDRSNEIVEPPSSPPVVSQNRDSDDDMELELPRGLGETPRHALAPPVSVVQVKETPHAKPIDDVMQPPPGPQTPNGESLNTSSVSVVDWTYMNQQSSGKRNVPGSVLNEANPAVVLTTERCMANENAPGPASKHVHFPPTGVDDAEMQDVPLIPLRSASAGQQDQPVASDGQDHIIESDQLEPTPISAQRPPPALSSSGEKSATVTYSQAQSPEKSGRVPMLPPTKRKLGTSPSKPVQRHPKRREIKIVDFGDSPPVRDTGAEIRRAREESLARLRQERRIGSGDVTMRDEESGMDEPRAARKNPSNYSRRPDDTSHGVQIRHPGNDLTKRSTQNRPTTSIARERDPSHKDMAVSDDMHDMDTVQLAQDIQRAQSVTGETNPHDRAPPLIPSTTLPRHTVVNTTPDQQSPGTLFDRFRVAYPEYTGSMQHFIGQCKQMHKLDLEDKMVPKWQWDDFIIRHRTDYKEYMLRCSDEGEDPEPYYRYYKDNIQDTLYNKGVIKNRNALLDALRELDALPRATSTATAIIRPVEHSLSPMALEPQVPAARPNKPGRKSLPWEPTPLADPPRDRPRHSLPNSTQTASPKTRDMSPSRRTTLHNLPPSTSSAVHGPHNPASTSRNGTSDPTFRKSREGSTLGRPVHTSRIPTEPTGDVYRDFCFAWSRATVVTGTVKSDKTKPWPENLHVRKKAEVPRPQGYDVLDWKDEL